MMFTNESLERLAVRCENLALPLRFFFGPDYHGFVGLMDAAEKLREMKRGEK